jgi:hypothetical protein
MANERSEVAVAGQRASVKLWPRERGIDGSIRLSVKAAGYGFGGRNRSVWISHAELKRFLRSLSEVDATRRGEATLESMSPDEFQLRLYISDRAGHTRADLVLARRAYADHAEDARVTFGFDFDPSFLPGLLRAFEQVALFGIA